MSLTHKELAVAITQVQEVAAKHLEHKSYFHLAPCGGCGLPAFQQPCGICGYYPYASERSTLGPFKQLPGKLFCDAVAHSGGNIGTWYAESYRKTLAPYLADKMLPDMQALVLPSAADILALVSPNSPQA